MRTFYEKTWCVLVSYPFGAGGWAKNLKSPLCTFPMPVDRHENTGIHVEIPAMTKTRHLFSRLFHTKPAQLHYQ